MYRLCLVPALRMEIQLVALVLLLVLVGVLWAKVDGLTQKVEYLEHERRESRRR